MGLHLEAVCKFKFWSRYLVKNSISRPSIINVIEAVRLCAFAPPGSSLDRTGASSAFSMMMIKRVDEPAIVDHAHVMSVPYLQRSDEISPRIVRDIELIKI
jgi:hypothetical protein